MFNLFKRRKKMIYGKLKKGDKIIVTVSRNGAPPGKILEIYTVYSNYYSVKSETGSSHSVYYNGNLNDEFHPATREERLKYLKGGLKEAQEEVTYIKAEIEMLEKFETVEDYVAYKLHKILSVKDDPEAIAKILKELKKTHYL